MSYAAVDPSLIASSQAPPPGGRPPGICKTDASGATVCPTFDPTWYWIGWAAVIGVVGFIMYKTLTMRSSVPMRANRRRKGRRRRHAVFRPALVGHQRRWGMLPNGRDFKCPFCNWSPVGATLPVLGAHVRWRHKAKYRALMGETASAKSLKLRKEKIKRRGQAPIKKNAGQHTPALAEAIRALTASSTRRRKKRKKKAGKWEWTAPQSRKTRRTVEY